MVYSVHGLLRELKSCFQVRSPYIKSFSLQTLFILNFERYLKFFEFRFSMK